MNSSFIFFILLFCSPILVFGLQMLFSRIFAIYRPNTSNHIIFTICVLVGYIPMGISIWEVFLKYLATPIELVTAGIHALIIYNALSYSYFHIFNMSETARRIRILNEIDKAKQLKASDVAFIYNADDMLKVRLERLMAMHQIKKIGDRYLLDQNLLYIVAKIVADCRNLLGFSLPKTFNPKK